MALRALTARPPRPQRDLQPPQELREVLRSQIPLAGRPGIAARAVAATEVGAAPMPPPAPLTDPQSPSPAPSAAARPAPL